MAIASNFPAIRPSLNLDFANAKTLDPRITFSRASAATYYDGKTVAKAEENLLTYSQEFDNAAWLTSGTAAVTANTASAPDGSVTADRILLSASSQKYQNKSVSGAVSVTMSVWAMSSTGVDQAFRLFGNDGTSNSPDLVATTSWQRFVFTYTAQSASVFAVGIRNAVSNSSSDILIWGAQLEQRSQVTAYTPTTTQPITNYIPVLQTAPAGVPRFDHNPVTGESLGLLVEEQRTNLVVRSEEFSSASWSKGGASVEANVVVAPDGSLTGDLLVSSNAAGYVYPSSGLLSAAGGGTFTYSVHAKAGNVSSFALLVSSGSYQGNYDLSAGTASTASANTTVSITHVGNGWYRCSMTCASVQTAPYSELQIGRIASGKTLYIWGAQLEAGAFPTSYIKTEASQVTRAADSAQMTGANFSSWYRQDEGTLFSDAATYAFDSSRVIFELNNGSTSNRLYISRIGSTYDGAFIATVNGVNTAHVGVSNAYAAGVSAKTAAAYKVDNFAVSLKGVTPATDSSGFVPVVDRMSIGSVTSEAFWSGTIKKLSYYPKRLSDAQLQALTA